VSASELLVTRPQPQADEWVAALRARGVPALGLPLIEIEPDADAAAAAWLALDAQRLVVFVSPNGVQSFFAQRPASAHWPAERWAAATGPGTSRALRAAGVPSEAILEPSHDAVQFDSEALWRRLQPTESARIAPLRAACQPGPDPIPMPPLGPGAFSPGDRCTRP